MPSNAFTGHLTQLLRDADDLDNAHFRLRTGSPGRQYRLAALNRAAVVVCVSAWESYIEELVRESLNAIRTYWEAELPKRHPNYPLVHPGEESGPPPPEEKKLRQLLARLPADTVYKLLLIMSLGRGDFDTTDLGSRYEELKERFEKPEQAAAQMVAKPGLADYLADGLDELKKNDIDADTLLATPAKPRK